MTAGSTGSICLQHRCRDLGGRALEPVELVGARVLQHLAGLADTSVD